MSKKQLTKKKVNVKLLPGQSYVVLSYETLMHIAETYDYLGNEKQDTWSQAFFDIADEIRHQTMENYFEDSSDEDYDW